MTKLSDEGPAASSDSKTKPADGFAPAAGRALAAGRTPAAGLALVGAWGIVGTLALAGGWTPTAGRVVFAMSSFSGAGFGAKLITGRVMGAKLLGAWARGGGEATGLGFRPISDSGLGWILGWASRLVLGSAAGFAFFGVLAAGAGVAFPADDIGGAAFPSAGFAGAAFLVRVF